MSKFLQPGSKRVNPDTLGLWMYGSLQLYKKYMQLLPEKAFSLFPGWLLAREAPIWTAKAKVAADNSRELDQWLLCLLTAKNPETALMDSWNEDHKHEFDTSEGYVNYLRSKAAFTCIGECLKALKAIFMFSPDNEKIGTSSLAQVQLVHPLKKTLEECMAELSIPAWADDEISVHSQDPLSWTYRIHAIVTLYNKPARTNCGVFDKELYILSVLILHMFEVIEHSQKNHKMAYDMVREVTHGQDQALFLEWPVIQKYACFFEGNTGAYHSPVEARNLFTVAAKAKVIVSMTDGVEETETGKAEDLLKELIGFDED